MYLVGCLCNRVDSSRERVSVPFPWQAGEFIETDTCQIWSFWLFHLVAPCKALFTQDEPWLSTAVEAHPPINSQWTLRTAHPHAHSCHLCLLVLVKASSRLPPPSSQCIHQSIHSRRSSSLLIVKTYIHTGQATLYIRVTPLSNNSVHLYCALWLSKCLFG